MEDHFWFLFIPHKGSQGFTRVPPLGPIPTQRPSPPQPRQSKSLSDGGPSAASRDHSQLSKSTRRFTPHTPPEYHVPLKGGIRPANKNAPPSSRTSIFTNHYQSSINQKSHRTKCTNSIKSFENIALSKKRISTINRQFI